MNLYKCCGSKQSHLCYIHAAVNSEKRLQNEGLNDFFLSFLRSCISHAKLKEKCTKQELRTTATASDCIISVGDRTARYATLTMT